MNESTFVNNTCTNYNIYYIKQQCNALYVKLAFTQGVTLIEAFSQSFVTKRKYTELDSDS